MNTVDFYNCCGARLIVGFTSKFKRDPKTLRPEYKPDGGIVFDLDEMKWGLGDAMKRCQRYQAGIVCGITAPGQTKDWAPILEEAGWKNSLETGNPVHGNHKIVLWTWDASRLKIPPAFIRPADGPQPKPDAYENQDYFLNYQNHPEVDACPPDDDDYYDDDYVPEYDDDIPF